MSAKARTETVTDVLEVSSPNDKATSDILRLQVGEEGADVERPLTAFARIRQEGSLNEETRCSHRRLHADYHVESGDSGQDRVVVGLLPLEVAVQGPGSKRQTKSKGSLGVSTYSGLISATFARRTLYALGGFPSVLGVPSLRDTSN